MDGDLEGRRLGYPWSLGSVHQEGTPHPLYNYIAWRDNYAELVLTTAFPFVIPNLITRILRNKLPRREMEPTVRITLVGMEQDF